MEPMQYDFSNASLKTPPFSLKNLKTLARVVDIIDGDTIVVVFPLYQEMHKFRVRLSDIDTCEMHSDNTQIHDKAIEARCELIYLVTLQRSITEKKALKQFLAENQCIVLLHCNDFDKYNRILAHVFNTNISEKSFSDILIDKNMAYPYFGKTKRTENEQLQTML